MSISIDRKDISEMRKANEEKLKKDSEYIEEKPIRNKNVKVEETVEEKKTRKIPEPKEEEVQEPVKKKRGRPSKPKVEKKSIKYGEVIPGTEEELDEKILDKDSNQWAYEVADKDIKYNVKMSDPKYATMKAKRDGNEAYVIDINDDKVMDVIIIDKDGEIISANGYSLKNSEQSLRNAYFASVKGSPNKNDVKYDKTYAKFKKEDKTVKKEMKPKKEKTLQANIKSDFKKIYDSILKELTPEEAMKFKKEYPFIVLSNKIVRSILNPIFDLSTIIDTKVPEYKKMNKIIKEETKVKQSLNNIKKFILRDNSDTLKQELINNIKSNQFNSKTLDKIISEIVKTYNEEELDSLTKYIDKLF